MAVGEQNRRERNYQVHFCKEIKASLKLHYRLLFGEINYSKLLLNML